MGRERACEATVQEIKPYFIWQDPGQIELLWNTVYRDAYRRPDDTLLNARECDSVWHSPGPGFPDPTCC